MPYAGVPFDDLLIYPARRGEYGPGDPAEQVAQPRAMALQFRPHRFERTRPNGRTHLVEGRPMEMDGRVVGFVTSYTDITEQRRSSGNYATRGEVFQTLVDNIPGGVTLFDAEMRLLASTRNMRGCWTFRPSCSRTAPRWSVSFAITRRAGNTAPTKMPKPRCNSCWRARNACPTSSPAPGPTAPSWRCGLPVADGGLSPSTPTSPNSTGRQRPSSAWRTAIP